MLCPILIHACIGKNASIDDNAGCLFSSCAWWDFKSEDCVMQRLTHLKDLDNSLFALSAKVGG